MENASRNRDFQPNLVNIYSPFFTPPPQPQSTNLISMRETTKMRNSRQKTDKKIKFRRFDCELCTPAKININLIKLHISPLSLKPTLAK